MSVERIIGIDFGTSTSLVKVKSYRDGKPVDGDPTSTQAVEFDNGRVTAPTLIRFAGEAVYFGQEAIPPKRDSELCSNFKLDLQSPDAAAKAKAQELTRKYFRYLYEQYSGQSQSFGQFDTERTLVSYPAKWAKETREFMLQAARDAGFKNVGGMDEPTAALYTVMVQESKRLVQQGYLTAGKPAYVLMIDMGAGTTDLALCKYTPGGQNRIIDTWPPAESKVLFGGREMDELLLQYLTEYLKKCDMPERMIANLEKNSLEDCKGWKENTVSSALARKAAAEDCAFVAPLLMMIGEAPPPFPAIDRAVLERYCKDYIGRYAELIAGAMAHARQADPDFNAGDLSLVVLTGGHSQWYFAKDMLCCSLPGYEGGVGVRLSADQVVALRPPQHTVSSGLVFSVQDLAPVEEPKPEQRRQADAEPAPPRPEQEQAGYTLPTTLLGVVVDAAISGVKSAEDSAGYNVILRSAGPRAINVIKVIRDLTGVELAEAKSIVDSAPSGAVKRSVSIETAESMKARLTEAGAEVEIVQAGIKPLIKGIAGVAKVFTGADVKKEPASAGGTSTALQSTSTPQPAAQSSFGSNCMGIFMGARKLELLTRIPKSECEKELAKSGENFNLAIRQIYDGLLTESDAEFSQRVSLHNPQSTGDLATFGSVMKNGTPVILESINKKLISILNSACSLRQGETLLFYFDFSATGQYKDGFFFTNERIIEVKKKYLSEKYSVKQELDFRNVNALMLDEGASSVSYQYIKFADQDEQSEDRCVNSPHIPTLSSRCSDNDFRLIIATYFRWNMRHGLEPGDIPLIKEVKSS